MTPGQLLEGDPMAITLTGQVAAVLIGQDRDSLVTTRRQEVNATFAGFEGDKHAGLTRKSDSRTPFYPRETEIRSDRQVSIVSTEELAQTADELGLPDLCPEWFGANLLLSGIAKLSLLPPGTRLFFAQGAVLIVQAGNNPCPAPGKIIQGHFPEKHDLPTRFVQAAQQRRGVVACVERPGLIHAGESVTVEVPEQVLYPPVS
jgi:hypothetical protein